jgi:hypothetical protein
MIGKRKTRFSIAVKIADCNVVRHLARGKRSRFCLRESTIFVANQYRHIVALFIGNYDIEPAIVVEICNLNTPRSSSYSQMGGR